MDATIHPYYYTNLFGLLAHSQNVLDFYQRISVYLIEGGITRMGKTKSEPKHSYCCLCHGPIHEGQFWTLTAAMVRVHDSADICMENLGRKKKGRRYYRGSAEALLAHNRRKNMMESGLWLPSHEKEFRKEVTKH